MNIRLSKFLYWSLFLIMVFRFSAVFAQKYAIYDADTQFSIAERYMMQDADPSCVNHKHFNAIPNPPGVPALSDAYKTNNNKCYEMYFPACQWSAATNFDLKCMSQPANQHEAPMGSDAWYAFSIFVPANYNFNPAWDLVFQMHDHPDNVGVCDMWTSPSFELDILNGNWVAWGLYDTLKCNNGVWPKTAFSSTPYPMTKGSWAHFVLHIRFDYRGGGLVELWLKDSRNPTPVKIADYSGRLGQNNDLAPYDYVSFGLYYGTPNDV
ncbi:MAG: heparin lyase I family protein, partial [Chitinivibrionales bacterium]|nr:heparin lyase I family protein [Chitinivibrionales bacterium]